MSKRLFIFIVLLLIPIIVVAQNAGREFSGWQWYDDGISFNYTYSIADNVGSRWLPASVNEAERIQLFFENYHGNGQWIETGAEINIMPISMLPDSMSALPDTLEALPTAAPDDIRNQLGSIVQSGDIPISVTQAQPLGFQSGFGFRFIAQVGNETSETRLSYRYVGKTADNNYLIMALFPLSANDIESPLLNALDTLISTLTITAPDSALLTAQTNGLVDYEGIQFSYDASLAYRIEVEYFAPITGAEAENTMFGVTPGYQQFSFAGYPVEGNILSPYLFVMPVSEFPDAEHIYGERLLQLQTLLAARPELTAAAEPGSQNPLPILPVINAAQTIVSQPQYMHFSNGNGVRYITYYSQSSEPLTATDLFYTFAGISDNGQYVVAATFPLYAAFLPQGRTVYNIADYERFAMNYPTYLDGLLLQIDVMDDRAYTPPIHLLDELITSIRVH